MLFPLLPVCDYYFLIALVCWSLPHLPREGGEGPNSAAVIRAEDAVAAERKQPLNFLGEY